MYVSLPTDRGNIFLDVYYSEPEKKFFIRNGSTTYTDYGDEDVESLGHVSERHERFKKKPVPSELRWAVFERDNFTCSDCGSRRFLQVDHVLPEVRGGKTELDNLQTLCAQCNRSKGCQ